MPSNVKPFNKSDFNEPMVIFPLKQYESLMDYVEDVEDRLAVAERINEYELTQQEFDELFIKKFGNK